MFETILYNFGYKFHLPKYPKHLKIKKTIADLYRSEWLDVACFAFLSGCLQCGISTTDGIRKFQDFLNLSEDDLDSDTLRTSFYRSQRRFKKVLTQEKPHLINACHDMKELNDMIDDRVKQILSKQ